MSSSDHEPESWITSFCQLLGHEYFAEVSEDFIEDDFNLTGLQAQVPMYKEALEMILDVEPEEDDEDEEEDEEDDDDLLGDRAGTFRRTGERRHLRTSSDLSVIENSAELLYGLIHQRYITSRPGIQQMAEKYELAHFGCCPRVYCNGVKVLPVGVHDTPGMDTVKLFCPSCLDIYTPPNSRFQSVDGAFFGTTFGYLFLMTFPELDVSANPYLNGRGGEKNISTGVHYTPLTLSGPDSPDQQPPIVNGVSPQNLGPGLGVGRIYEPKIYGFKVAEIARTGPRMKWLRTRPDDLRELDESALFLEQDQGKLNDDGVYENGDMRGRNQRVTGHEGVADGGGVPMDTSGDGDVVL